MTRRSLKADPVLRFMQSLWLLDHHLQSQSKRMQKEVGITGAQRFVLRLVGRAPGISPSILAEKMHVDKSTVSVILRSLEASGTVERRVSVADGRAVDLHLTEKGRHAIRRRAKTVEAAVHKTFRLVKRSDVQAARRVLDLLSRTLSKEIARGT